VDVDDPVRNVLGEPLSDEGRRMLRYLRSRAAGVTPDGLRQRLRAAVAELDALLDGVREDDARRHPIRGAWSIAEVVDHLAQTQIRAAEELRHLLAGRRPPAPPVYEGLLSGAAAWAPWQELLGGLRSANDEFDAVLATSLDGADRPLPAAVRTVLVVNQTAADGRSRQETFTVDLGCKEYVLLQRLHVLDHRTQIRKLREALGP
jgi:hypothetical protein